MAKSIAAERVRKARLAEGRKLLKERIKFEKQVLKGKKFEEKKRKERLKRSGKPLPISVKQGVQGLLGIL